LLLLHRIVELILIPCLLVFLSQAATFSTNLPIAELEIPSIHTLEDLTDEGKLAFASLNDTKEDRKLHEVDAKTEEKVDSSIKVNTEIKGDPNMSTASIYQAKGTQENRSLDIEEGAGMLDDANNEEEENHYSSNSSADGSLATCSRARRRSTLSSGESTADHNVCPICLGAYKEGSMLFTSKHCAHIFHGDCILEWLTKHEDCPVCRAQMVTEEEMLASAMALVNKTTTSSS
jgi:hypothetical protein